MSVLLLPAIAALWSKKADKSSIEDKLDTVNEALDSHENDAEHLRQWLTMHQASDERSFAEIRQAHKDIANQIQHNFETLILEIRRNGKGN